MKGTTTVPITTSQLHIPHSPNFALVSALKSNTTKARKNNFQLDQWDDLTHHTPIQLLLPKRETKSQQWWTVEGTPLLKSQAALKSHLKTYLLLSQRFLGRPSTFPLVSLYLNFPTVQCFPPHGDTLRECTEGLRHF